MVVVGTDGEDLGDVGEGNGGGFDEGWSWIGSWTGSYIDILIGIIGYVIWHIDIVWYIGWVIWVCTSW